MSAGHDGPVELAAEVVGRALRALEPDEEDRVAEHLRDCAACRALLSEAHETLAAVAHALRPVEPRPALRDRILAAASAEPEPPARPAPTPRDAGPTRVPPEAGPTPTPTTPTSVPAAPAPRRRAAVVLALAAVVAAVVVFAARAAVPAPADPREAVAQQAQQVVASAEARDPSVRTASLIVPGSGTVAAVVLDDGTGPRVVPLAMPDLGSGRSFVLWRVAGDAATPVGTLDANGGLIPTTTGPGAPAPPTPDRARRAYALSAERTGTVPTHPSAVVASGPLV